MQAKCIFNTSFFFYICKFYNAHTLVYYKQKIFKGLLNLSLIDEMYYQILDTIVE